MTALVFSPRDVAVLVTITRKAKAYRLTMNDLIDPQMWLPGTKADEHGFVTSDKIDPAKLTPKLWLVKDQGCYLMSNAADQSRTENGSAFVVYAAGLGKDCDYGALRQAVGGDDFAEAIPLEDFETMLAKKPLEIVIELTEDRLEIYSTRAR